MSAPRLAKIWMNGQMVDAETAPISVISSTLHDGWGVLEDFRSFRTMQGAAVFMHRPHIERLMQSANILGISIDWNVDQLMQATKELLKKNNHGDASIRIMVFTGAESLETGVTGSHGRVVIFTYPNEIVFNPQTGKNGIRVRTTHWKLFGPHNIPVGANITGTRFIANFARKEALECGYDEVLFVDAAGYVQQTACHEIFVIQDGELIVTPWLERSGMSVTKSVIIELARNLDIPTSIKNFDISAIRTSDEVFVASPGSSIVSVGSLDDREIAPKGPITRSIAELYSSITHGENPRFNHMIDPV